MLGQREPAAVGRRHGRRGRRLCGSRWRCQRRCFATRRGRRGRTRSHTHVLAGSRSVRRLSGDSRAVDRHVLRDTGTPGGSYSSDQTVTLHSTTASAIIGFSLDATMPSCGTIMGGLPTCKAGTKYTAPVTVAVSSTPTKLTAVAGKGLVHSVLRRRVSRIPQAVGACSAGHAYATSVAPAAPRRYAPRHRVQRSPVRMGTNSPPRATASHEHLLIA